MDGEYKQCCNCEFMKRYYTKGMKQYDKTKYGWCYKKCAVVNAHDGCERFSVKIYRKRVNGLIRHRLNDLLTELSEIRKVLEEEGDESEKL